MHGDGRRGPRVQRAEARANEGGAAGPAPGKQTRVDDLHAVAARGTATTATRLPHLELIQKQFGKFDISGIQAHAGAEAAGAADELGARAYATGDHVVMGGETDLFTAAHEAAHVVQQRAGAAPAGGIDAGRGDPLEEHANQVAAAVVRGESAEPLLEQFAAGARPTAGGGGFMPVQRAGNDPEDPAIRAIFENAMLPQDGVQALLASPHPALQYGLEPGTDEEAEIAAGASYLHQRKLDWRAELAHRQATGAVNQRPAWERYQAEMGAMTPGVPANAPPWFMDPGFGYQVHGGNAARLAQIGTDRNAPDPDDPQQLFGMTYQRDTMYTIEQTAGSPILRHRTAVDGATPTATFAAWTNDVFRLMTGGLELRLRIAGALDDAGTAEMVVSGAILEGPVSNAGIAPGTAVQIRKSLATGALTITNGVAAVATVAAGWTGQLESFAYHQSRTRIDEGLGANHPRARDNRSRNRADANVALDDATFNEVEDRYDNPMNPDRDYQHTLGPQRTRLNVHDDPGTHEVGFDIDVAKYRRLGGDAIFREANHPAPQPYQNQLQPANAVDVNNPDWYYDQANQMPDRFVGGRSNSTGLYMSSGTMLFHEGRLTLAEAKDVLAFVIADMVVSGEHSMPECMTTVVMAAGSSQPWQATNLNLAGPTDTLAAWLRLIDAPTRQAMAAEARASLLRMVDSGGPDLKLIKVMTILLKAL